MGDALSSYPDTPLKLAMSQRQVSIRGLAKLLEPGADEARLSNLRGQIRGWLKGGEPQAGNALRLAQALELDDRYFLKEKPQPQGVRAELVELQSRVDALEETIRAHLAELPPARSASGRRSQS